MNYSGITVEGATDEMIQRALGGENLSFAAQQSIFDRHHHVNDGDGIGFEEDNHNPDEPFDYSSLPESAFDKSANVEESVSDPLPAAKQEESEEIIAEENQAWLRLKKLSVNARQYVEKQGKPGERKFTLRPEKQHHESRPYYEEVGNGSISMTKKREISNNNGGVKTNFGGKRGYDRNIESKVIENAIDDGFDEYDSVDYSIEDEIDLLETPVVRKDKEYYFNLFQEHKWDTHVDLDTEFEKRDRIIGLYIKLRRGTIDTVSLRDLRAWYRHFETTPDFEEDLDDVVDTFDDFEDYEDLAPIEVEDAAKQKGAVVEYFNLNADGETYTVGIIEKIGQLKKRREIVVKKLVYASELRKGQVEDRTAPQFGFGEWIDNGDKRSKRKAKMRNGDFSQG